MLKNRYVLWTTVWEWFAATDTKEPVSRERWEGLHELLNRLWEDERQDATPEELAAHAVAISRLKH
jgi:hypothetical protein